MYNLAKELREIWEDLKLIIVYVMNFDKCLNRSLGTYSGKVSFLKQNTFKRWGKMGQIRSSYKIDVLIVS